RNENAGSRLPLEQATGHALQFVVVLWSRAITRAPARHSPCGDENASGAGELLEAFERFAWHLLDIRQDDDLVRILSQAQRAVFDASVLFECVVVEEVKVVSRGENCWDQVRSDSLPQSINQTHSAGPETRPRVIVGKVDRHVVGGLSLTH